MYFWPFLQQYMGEVIYFQRCNAPNGPNISSIIVKTYAKLKKSFRLVVLGYTWYFLIWGGLSLAPNPGKLKFLIGFLSKSSQYNINVRYELSFLWKSEPDWWSLSGVLDWCAIWSPPRYLHFQYMYFGPVMYFLRNILVESHLVAPALANNMVFSLKFSYFAKFKYILMQPHRSEFGASWSQYCQTISTVISDVILKPVQSDLVCATLYSGQISAL